uniref:Reverse transcriptase domain-containing protein n=1 Tax=Tanacetum cinerariifolium TaxID=118510 RepID=A0A699K3Y4_TANCI|nr:hypothetical protein [Tanacetum cinerariifolium]
MNQNFYNSNSAGFDQIQSPQYPVIHPPPQETSVEILQAKENLMKYIQTFFKKFNCIYFRETPKVLTLAWEKFFEIQHAQPEDIHKLLRELLEDLQIIKNSSNAITPDLPTEEPDNSLSMRDEHLSTILEMKSDDVIKYSVENLVPLLSESEGIFDDTCDVPFYDNSPPLDVLNDHFELFFDFNDDCTSSDDDSFEDIDYIEASPPDSELVSLEEYTTYADNSLLEYDSFLFEIEPDQGELTSIVMEDILGEPHVHVPNVLPTHPTLLLDSDFIPSNDSLGSDPKDCSDFEDSRACGFVHCPLELLSLACLYMGI